MMTLDWHVIDRFLMGEAWAGSRVVDLRDRLCYDIGPRWGGSDAEREAAGMILANFEESGLSNARLETFDLDTWDYSGVSASISETGREVAIKPFLRCPPLELTAPLVDVGYGTAREIAAAGGRLKGAVALMRLAPEPFTLPPLPHTARLTLLAKVGAAAAMVTESKNGGRMEYRSANDWRAPGIAPHPLPTVNTPLEEGGALRREAERGLSITLKVESRFFTAPSQNVVGEIPGEKWPGEHVIVAGHHDTVFGTAGGNDNTSGTVAVMEAARVLGALKRETGIGPGRAIRFATWSGEEQGLQGAYAYVARHHGTDGRKSPPRFALNLDELSTGHMKGVVAMFPHLRDFMQAQLDTMGDGLKCHVQATIDAHSDHFPFARAGVPAGILWRWRFHSRHADAEFHHEAADTADKLNVRELKEYVGQIARLMLRLSHVPPQEWPENPVTAAEVEARSEREIGTHSPVFHG
jgi:hypothetical protein